jgi:hypothetical protein
MADLNVYKTTNVGMTDGLDDFITSYSVSAQSLDSPDDTEETYWYFSKAAEYLGYYKQIPELKKAIDALALWTVGKGFNTNIHDKIILDHIQGWGEDTIHSILWNMVVMKKVIGDSFAEIIRDKDSGTIINLKPISPERMRIVVGKNGVIKRYEQYAKTGVAAYKKYDKEDILHLCNDRVGDEIHGVSVIEACEWVILARNECLTDHKKVIHRNVVPVRIIEIDSDDSVKIAKLKAEYKDAITKGEVLIIPKGTVAITQDTITIQDPISWIQYLENFFYQAVGIPRVIATSQDYTEAGSKVGYLTFEPVYTFEQTLLESDLWNQLGIKIAFNRPPSLKDNVQSDEAKNTGQVGFQPKESSINMERE